MRIIKIWLYTTTDKKEHDADDCKHFIKDIQRGEFVYYKTDGKNVEPAHRRDADKQKEETGEAPELYLGYPTFMYDLGFRA